MSRSEEASFGIHEGAVAEVNVNGQHPDRAVTMPDNALAIRRSDFPVAAGMTIVAVVIEERRGGHVDVARINGARCRRFNQYRRMRRCVSENSYSRKEGENGHQREAPGAPVSILTSAGRRHKNDHAGNHHIVSSWDVRGNSFNFNALRSNTCACHMTAAAL